MTVPRFAILLLVSVLMVPGAFAASLDSAREHYESGDLDAARSELRDLLDASDDAAVRADALNLLGTIAVDRQEWTQAHEAWSLLLAEYPESAAAGEARTKLTLVTALMDAQGEKPAPPPPAPTSSPAPTSPPAPTMPSAPAPATVTPAPEPAPEPAPPSPSAPTSTTAAAEPAPAAAETSNLVLVAGRGKPYDAVEDSTRRLITWLLERGVHAESATTEVAVVQDSDLVLAQLLEVVRKRGAHSLLYIDARFNHTPDNVKYYLYLPSGSELWRTRVRGGTGWTGEPYSKSGIDEKLFLRSLNKLEKMIGGPGLPVE